MEGIIEKKVNQLVGSGPSSRGMQVNPKWFSLFLYCLGCLFFVSVIIFAVFYWVSGYSYLAQWYHGLGQCFYKEDAWQRNFFTQAVKVEGNLCCIIALPVCFAGLLLSIKHIVHLHKAPSVKNKVAINIYHIPALLNILLFSFAMWHHGNHIALPAYDEVFSAVNVAGIHPFQGASYYMLPNNHVFFNLLNNILFHSATDKVCTGRILSLLFYTCFSLIIYFTACKVFKNILLSLVVTLCLASQFFVWGFSFQARGYELYLLLECCMVISFARRLYKGQAPGLVCVLCCACGYFTMPSFLYLHAGLLVFTALYQLMYRDTGWRLWRWNIAAGALTFLLYLPVLCFSGARAITANGYVAPMATYKTAYAFCQWMLPYFQPYLSHIFSGVNWFGPSTGIVLFLFPLLLLFSKKRSVYSYTGLFYVTAWLVFFIIVVIMKRLPFERNLIGHYSLTLCSVIMTIHWLSTLVFRSKAKAVFIMPCIGALLLAIHFWQTNGRCLQETLYEYNVNNTYNGLSSELEIIPQGSKVGISAESFYCGPISAKRGCAIYACPNGDETYYIKHQDEDLPPHYLDKYSLQTKVNQYEVYKLK